MSDSNRMAVDWSVDAITVGARHRKDLGDIDALAGSIAQLGLLQPLTITPGGVLVCGARRLAAIKELGWRTANVWILTGLSERLMSLMAERDDNFSHKGYTNGELAELYAELKAEIAADAARRQEATRFGAETQNSLSDGGGNFPPPQTLPGKTREQAAEMLGGQASYKTLEKVLAIKQVADDETASPELRHRAAEAAQLIDDGAPVDPLYLGIRAAVTVESLERDAADANLSETVREAAKAGAILLRKLEAEGTLSPQDMDKAARAALDRVLAAHGRKPKPTTPKKPRPVEPAGPKQRNARYFTWIWNEMAHWPEEYDKAVIAAEVTDDTWRAFKQTMAEGIEFTEEVDRLRAEHAFSD
jgi:ParB family chromosome partitioning protein